MESQANEGKACVTNFVLTPALGSPFSTENTPPLTPAPRTPDLQVSFPRVGTRGLGQDVADRRYSVNFNDNNNKRTQNTDLRLGPVLNILRVMTH